MGPTVKLKNNVEIPLLGFGTWQMTGPEAEESVVYALKSGYRHVDTAEIYGNHRQVGNALKYSGLKREEIFLTSKLWRTEMKKERVRGGLEKALYDLKVDYLDLYLIHWPDKKVPIADTLGEMAKLKEEGLIKAIGVSNFTVSHLKDALETGVEISNNQVEFHPSLNQEELRKFCVDKGIILTAYSPIAQGHDLELPEVIKIAQKHKSTPARVVLAWLRQKNIVAIPKAVDKGHIDDNFASLKLTIDQEEVDAIDKLNSDYRVVNPGFNEFDY